MIDPFSGEGIANSIRSGRFAAAHVLKAFEQKQFDAAFNKKYDEHIYSKMWNELRLGHTMQKLARYPSIINFVVKKANNNKSIQTLINSMLNDMDLKKQLVKPSLYFRLFFS